MKKALLAICLGLLLSGCTTSYYYYQGNYYKKVSGPVDAVLFVLDRKGNWIDTDRGGGIGEIHLLDVAQRGEIIDGGKAQGEAGKRKCAAAASACKRAIPIFNNEPGGGEP